MGYSTDFTGEVLIDPPLCAEEISYLQDFAATRHMRRTLGPYLTMPRQDTFPPPPDVMDVNHPFPGQPGLWCHWLPTDEGDALEWDGVEKSYDTPEWMRYLIEHFLAPQAVIQALVASAPQVLPDERLAHFTFDHVVNGVIFAEGEDPSDRWALHVVDNVVQVAQARLVYNTPEPVNPADYAASTLSDGYASPDQSNSTPQPEEHA